MDLEPILAALGQQLVESPALSIMIVDREMNIVWHNASYARDMGGGPDLVGMKCYAAASDVRRHAGCPTRASLFKGKTTRGLYDFGARNALVITMPLPHELAAKIHVFLPKEAGNSPETL
ncbi:MAG: hypothetical protein ACM3X6_01225 [Patescibacteria group bacterium]